MNFISNQNVIACMDLRNLWHMGTNYTILLERMHILHWIEIFHSVIYLKGYIARCLPIQSIHKIIITVYMLEMYKEPFQQTGLIYI